MASLAMGLLGLHADQAWGQAPSRDDLPDRNGDGHPMYSNPVAPTTDQPFWHGNTQSFCLADLDGDGDVDAAAANGKGLGNGVSAVAVLLNDGDGMLGTPWYIAGVGDNPFHITAGDLDGDGDQDLVTVQLGSHDLAVLLNDGAGRFAPPVYFPVGQAPRCVRLGDFDNDGKLDAVTMNSGTGDLSILMNIGGGTFGPEERIFVGSAFGFGKDETGPFMDVADLDLDGDQDIAIPTGTTIRFAWNKGTGGGASGFSFNLSDSLAAVGGPIFAVRAGDLNNDGAPDLASVSSTNSVLGVYLSKGKPPGGGSAGMFKAGTGYALTTPFPINPQPSSFALGDFNGDGFLDAAAASSSPNYATFVLLNQQDGTFGPFEHRLGDEKQFQSEAADMNGDGLDDVCVLMSTGGRIATLLSRPDHPVESFLANVYWQMAPANFAYPTRLASADVDRDGDLDAVVAMIALGAPPGGLHVVPAEDGRLVGGGTPYLASSKPIPYLHDVVAADFNGDGWIDLAVSHYNFNFLIIMPGSVSVLLNQGDGTFGAPIEIDIPIAPFTLVPGDLDGDSDLDLAVVGFGPYEPNGGFDPIDRRVQLLWNPGDGALVPGESHAMNLKPMNVDGAARSGLALGDLDGDGDLDLLACVGQRDVSYGELAIRWNDRGNFDQLTTHVLPEWPIGVGARDLDGDADLDVAVLYSFMQDPPPAPTDVLTLATYLNDGQGGLDAARSFKSAQNPEQGSPFRLSGPDASGAVLAFYLETLGRVVVQRIDEQKPDPAPFRYGTGPLPQGFDLREHEGRIDVVASALLADNIALLPDRRRWAPGGPCPADCDENGTLDIDDFICFQTAFVLGALAADCDGDQSLTINDFICFQTAFVIGC